MNILFSELAFKGNQSNDKIPLKLQYFRKDLILNKNTEDMLNRNTVESKDSTKKSFKNYFSFITKDSKISKIFLNEWSTISSINNQEKSKKKIIEKVLKNILSNSYKQKGKKIYGIQFLKKYLISKPQIIESLTKIIISINLHKLVVYNKSAKYKKTSEKNLLLSKIFKIETILSKILGKPVKLIITYLKYPHLNEEIFLESVWWNTKTNQYLTNTRKIKAKYFTKNVDNSMNRTPIIKKNKTNVNFLNLLTRNNSLKISANEKQNFKSLTENSKLEFSTIKATNLSLDKKNSLRDFTLKTLPSKYVTGLTMKITGRHKNQRRVIPNLMSKGGFEYFSPVLNQEPYPSVRNSIKANIKLTNRLIKSYNGVGNIHLKISYG